MGNIYYLLVNVVWPNECEIIYMIIKNMYIKKLFKSKKGFIKATYVQNKNDKNLDNEPVRNIFFLFLLDFSV